MMYTVRCHPAVCSSVTVNRPTCKTHSHRIRHGTARRHAYRRF